MELILFNWEKENSPWHTNTGLVLIVGPWCCPAEQEGFHRTPVSIKAMLRWCLITPQKQRASFRLQNGQMVTSVARRSEQCSFTNYSFSLTSSSLLSTEELLTPPVRKYPPLLTPPLWEAIQASGVHSPSFQSINQTWLNFSSMAEVHRHT
jgi:hypothetical protein